MKFKNCTIYDSIFKKLLSKSKFNKRYIRSLKSEKIIEKN